MLLWGLIKGNLHLHNAVVGADIKDLASKLVSQKRDGLQVLVLVSEGLAGCEFVGVVVSGMSDVRHGRSRVLRWFFLRCGDFPMVLQKLFKDFRTQNADFGKKKLTLHESCVGVVEDGPHGDKVI